MIRANRTSKAEDGRALTLTPGESPATMGVAMVVEAAKVGAETTQATAVVSQVAIRAADLGATLAITRMAAAEEIPVIPGIQTLDGVVAIRGITAATITQGMAETIRVTGTAKRKGTQPTTATIPHPKANSRRERQTQATPGRQIRGGTNHTASLAEATGKSLTGHTPLHRGLCPIWRSTATTQGITTQETTETQGITGIPEIMEATIPATGNLMERRNKKWTVKR